MGFNLYRNIQYLICTSTLSFSNQIIDASNPRIDHTDASHHFNQFTSTLKRKLQLASY